MQAVVKWIVIIIAFCLIGKVLQDDRVQEPYKSILGFGILIAIGLIGWYFRNAFGWWQ